MELFEEFIERKFFLGTGLHPEIRSDFIKFLKYNADCFAWSHEDMIGIPTEVAIHKLSLDPNIPPVRKKKHPIVEARNKFIKEEVTSLLNIISIPEVKYPNWLSNVVVILKKNNKFRMCVDYKDLRKPFSKDLFSLPNINQMIDATWGTS